MAPVSPFLPDWVRADIGDLKAFTPFPGRVPPLEDYMIAGGTVALGPFYFKIGIGEGDHVRRCFGFALSFYELSDGEHRVWWGDGGRTYEYALSGYVIRDRDALIARTHTGTALKFRPLRPTDARHLFGPHGPRSMTIERLTEALRN